MRRDGRASVVFARSSEMRAGLSMVNATGSAGGAAVTQGQLQLLARQVLHVDRLELVRRALRVRGRAQPGRRRQRQRATTMSRRSVDG